MKMVNEDMAFHKWLLRYWKLVANVIFGTALCFIQAFLCTADFLWIIWESFDSTLGNVISIYRIFFSSSSKEVECIMDCYVLNVQNTDTHTLLHLSPHITTNCDRMYSYSKYLNNAINIVISHKATHALNNDKKSFILLETYKSSHFLEISTVKVLLYFHNLEK